MPELEQIFELKEYLYKESCPIVIKSGELLFDPESNCIYASMVIKNIYDKVISSLLLDIHVFDRANNEIEVLRDYQYFGLEIPRDGEFGGDTQISIINSSGKSFSVAVKKVVFNDDTEWSGTASLLYENLPRRVTLLEELEDEATVEQYRRNFSEKIAENKTVRAELVPAACKDLWICSCGEINHNEEEKCYNCGAEYEPQKEMIDNRVQLAADLSEYNRIQAEKAEQARLEAERKAAEEATAKAEAERKAAEEAAAAALREKRRKRRNKIFISVSIPLVILAIIYAIVHVTYIKPTMEYNSGKELLAQGKYDEAIAVFTSLEGFSDSEDAILDAKYQKASAVFEADSYDEAIALFTEIADYKDSQQLIYDAEYEKAVAVMDSGDYDKAVELLTALDGHKDCEELIEECYYLKGMDLIPDGSLEDAKACYANIISEDYIIDMQNAFCDEGLELYAAQEDDKAHPYFELVTDSDIYARINEAYYNRAIGFIDTAEYDAALAILETITDYSDSADQINRIHFLKGEALFAGADYYGAEAEYIAAGEYEGAADKLTETRYNIAYGLYNNYEYQAAAEAFLALGDYSNSHEMYQESTYQYGYSQYVNNDIFGAYDTLYAIKDYYPAWYLLINRSQFYIYIYDPGLGPNPLDE